MATITEVDFNKKEVTKTTETEGDSTVVQVNKDMTEWGGEEWKGLFGFAQMVEEDSGRDAWDVFADIMHEVLTLGEG